MDASVAIKGLRAFDPGALQVKLQGSSLELVLLEGSAPCASVVPFVHDAAVLCNVDVDARLKGRLTAAHDQVLLGCVQAADPNSCWLDGAPLDAGAMFFIAPDAAHDFAFDQDARLTLLALPAQRIRRHFGSEDAIQRMEQLSGCRHPVLHLYTVALGHRINTGAVSEDEVEEWLVAFSQALASDQWQSCHCQRSRRVRYQIFRRAEDFMRQHMRRDIYMQELCEITGVSERALRYAFVEMVGVAPGRFLAMLRLCEACRQLSASGSGRRSVKSIALNCGLWDLSRFAESYRRVFGELPRQTLMRAAALDG